MTFQANALLYLGALCMLASVFQKPLGLPAWSQFLLGGVAVICIWGTVWLQRRAKKAGDPRIVEASPQQKRRHTFLLITVLFLASATAPIVLPYTTELALPLTQRVAISALSFFVLIAILFAVQRRR